MRNWSCWVSVYIHVLRFGWSYVIWWGFVLIKIKLVALFRNKLLLLILCRKTCLELTHVRRRGAATESIRAHLLLLLYLLNHTPQNLNLLVFLLELIAKLAAIGILLLNLLCVFLNQYIIIIPSILLLFILSNVIIWCAFVITLLNYFILTMALIDH